MRKRTKKHCELHKLRNNDKIYETIDLNMLNIYFHWVSWEWTGFLACDLLATILIVGDFFAES